MKLAGLTVAAVMGLGLGGCVSLLPKAKPSQLYRFEVETPLPTADAGANQRSGVVLSAIDFPRAATGDGILTVTGDETAYIAGARWVAPAAVLFREQMLKAFDNRARRALIVNPGDAGPATAILRLSVLNFEARYSGGAPTVVETLRARLTSSDGRYLGERTFDVRVPAANRVSAIVDAFGQATQKVLTDLVAWTDDLAPARAAPSEAAARPAAVPPQPAPPPPAPPLPAAAPPASTHTVTSSTQTSTSAPAQPPR